MADYLADVLKYDGGADEAIVNKIVRHLGIALRNKDSSLVSVTDPKELERIKQNWCEKKFGSRARQRMRPLPPRPRRWPPTARNRA